jgi:hypothetical protein
MSAFLKITLGFYFYCDMAIISWGDKKAPSGLFSAK